MDVMFLGRPPEWQTFSQFSQKERLMSETCIQRHSLEQIKGCFFNAKVSHND